MLFESRENKATIWNELKRINYFNGFKASSKDEVRRLLDNSITMVAIQKPQLSVADKNHDVIQQMMANRDLFVSQERHANPGVMDNTITAEGMRELREQEFARQLGKHQAEFDNLINKGRPEDIDFSDKMQEQRIGGEMESLVARAQQMRQMDLESASKNTGGSSQSEVERWINGGRPLRIEHDSNLPVEAQSLTPRKVRFTEPKSEEDIFARLKTKPVDSLPRDTESRLEKLEKQFEYIENMGKKLETILERILSISQSLANPTSKNVETDSAPLP
jgi:hypothetical protein